MCYEQNDKRNGVMGEGQGLSSAEDGETRADDATADANNGPVEVIQVNGGVPFPPQASQNSAIRWERFLPIRSLKVLLVENDDSTRHVVSALLQNCSYEVTAVANGLQAWRVLEDLNNHIDVVLTEVVMPVLSGIGLLCKVMSHKTLKNIPVIMMSSHDSMGIVFKCLSKGAVDFLVKPVRKNELKNLWQHVWRRCHSSSGSGSGSESGTQSKKSVNSKSNEASGNDTASSEEPGDNGSNGPSIRDGSDHGSGTQSSWTNRAVELDSPHTLSPACQLPDAPDSTCAQVIHTKPEVSVNMWAHVTETKEWHKKDKQPDDLPMGKDLELRVSRNPDLNCHDLCENGPSHHISKKKNKTCEVDSKPLANGHLENQNENMSIRMGDQSIKTDNANANCIAPHASSKKFDASVGAPDILRHQDGECFDSRELPSLDLSLKRLREVGDSTDASKNDKNILRHSDLSAFSKYNTSSANQGPLGNVGSCSPLDNGSDAMKAELTHTIPFHQCSPVLNQQSNGSSYNNDMASTAKNFNPKQEALNDKFESTSAFKSFHSAFQPVQNVCPSSLQQVLPGKTEDIGVDTSNSHLRGSHQKVQVQHHHHHHHHHHHFHHQVHGSQHDHNDLSLKNMAASVPQCGSSNMVGGLTDANTGNFSVNGSASGSNHGSNHGSNGQNGSSTGLNTGVTNMESDNGAAGNSAAGGVSGRSSGNVVDKDRIALREAALTKFRQKRKERCFEKRVRYQSRKKLAEQRPRVKGQFVRQKESDSMSGKDCQSNELTSEDNSCDSGR